MENQDNPVVDTPVDPTQNVKAEFDRKLQNLNEQLAALSQKLTPAPAPVQAEKIEDLIYSQPERAFAIVEERAAAKIRAELAEREQKQARHNSILNKLITDYPELNNPSSRFYQEASQAYNALPEADKSNPAMWQAVVYQKAAEAGIKPASKRSSSDDFTLGNSRVMGEPGQPKGSVDPMTVEFAKIINEGTGRDVNSKEYKERLAAFQQEAKARRMKRRQ